VHHYAIYVDGDEVEIVDSKELDDGEYTLEFDAPGKYTIMVRALDHAGNDTDSPDVNVVVEGYVPVATSDEEAPEEGEGVDWGYLFSMLALAIAVYFYVRIVYERRNHMQEKEVIKKEAQEAQEKLELIFNALREEIEEQVHVLAKQPYLTDHERQVLQRLKDSLEISEELLDKEIEDVRKLLK
jgi:predicted phage tail protein